MVDTSGSVDVKTLDDVETLRNAFYRGGLDRPPIAVNRRAVAKSGTAIFFAGTRYKDGLLWSRSW